YQILEANDERLFGSGRAESRRTRNDRRRLGGFYLVDWMLSRGTQPFTVADAMQAAEKMNTKITFSADFAGVVITEAIDILEKGEFLTPVQPAADQARVADSSSTAYRVVPRRLTALAGDAESAERSSFTEFTDATEPAPAPEIAGRYRIAEELGQG